MSNPFRAPSAAVETPEEPTQKFGALFWLVGIGATVLAIGLGLLSSLLLPAFESVYISFGTALPAPTALLTSSRYYLWLGSLTAIGIWLFLWLAPSRHQFRARIFSSFLALGVACGGSLLFALWAMYLPIFQLGAAP